MRKPHLFSTENPHPQHLWGVQLLADCGMEVPQAHCMAMVDTYSDVWLTGKSICERCKKAHIMARYLYVIAEGQAIIDEAQAV